MTDARLRVVLQRSLAHHRAAYLAARSRKARWVFLAVAFGVLFGFVVSASGPWWATMLLLASGLPALMWLLARIGKETDRAVELALLCQREEIDLEGLDGGEG